jgi:succinoglycan biosynthesis transport protein ExoP
VLTFLRQAQKEKVDSVDDAEEALIKQFAQDIEIMPIRGARLAHVTANASRSGALAAQIANTLVSVYIERNQELSTNSKEQAAQWFTTHLEELRQKVQNSQQALYVVSREAWIVDRGRAKNQSRPIRWRS